MMPRPAQVGHGLLTISLCWLVDLASSLPKFPSSPPRSILTCHSLRQTYQLINGPRTTRILEICDIDGTSTEWKRACHADQVTRNPRWNNISPSSHMFQALTVPLVYYAPKLVRRFHRIQRHPTFQQRLDSRFHWIDWNDTYPHIRQPPNTTHVKCEWRFQMPRERARQTSARLFIINKNWARRALGERGCNKKDSRLIISATNTTGKTTTEKERFCGRHPSLPSQHVKKFYPETVSVTLTYRTNVQNSNPGPFGYFFTYAENIRLSGCAFGCEHSGGEGYSRCDNITSLPPFLRISVAESRKRSYTSDELQQGLNYAADYRNLRSSHFHCIDRYPIFKQLFAKGEIINKGLVPTRRQQAQGSRKVEFTNGSENRVER